LNGDVIWSNHTFNIRNVTIGTPLTINATAYIKNELNVSVNVTAKLLVDGELLKNMTLPIEKEGNVSVSATWIPVSSGAHFISLNVSCDRARWVGPTNDPTAKVEVFIEKVEQ